MLPTTPIEELQIRRVVYFRLREEHIYCLEDLSAITERDLLKMPGVGRTTVEYLRSALETIGLSFLPEPDPDRADMDRTRHARRTSPAARAKCLDGLSSIADLGLSIQTFKRAKSRGYRAVDDLRRLTARQFAMEFGAGQAREILETLKAVGLPSIAPSSPLDLWRFGILRKDELVRPSSPETPIEQLAPWVGKGVTASLARNGTRTLGDLHQLLRDGRLDRVRGIGAANASKVRRLLLGEVPVAKEQGKLDVFDLFYRRR